MVVFAALISLIAKARSVRFWPTGTFSEVFKAMYDSTVVALNVVKSSFVGVENNFIVNL